MKKLKYSILTKVLAWILITICGLSFVGTALTTIFFIDNGYYERTYEDIKQDAYSLMAQRYAVKALSNYIEESKSDFVNDSGVSYGIIKADNLDKVNIQDLSNYVKTNFMKYQHVDDKHILNTLVSNSTYFTFTDGYFGEGMIHRSNYYGEEDIEMTPYEYDYVCYDTNHGIFYYCVDALSSYYPVKKIRVNFFGNDYIFDYYTAATSVTHDEFPAYKLSKVERSSGDNSIITDEHYDEYDSNELRLMLNRGQFVNDENKDEVLYINDIPLTRDNIVNIDHMLSEFNNPIYFNNLTKYGINIFNFGSIELDNLKLFNGDYEIRKVTKDNYYRENDNYIVQDSNTLLIDNKEAYTGKYGKYSVIVEEPDDIQASPDGNLFSQALYYTSYFYNMRYITLIIMAVSAIIGLLLFIYLLSAAGHRNVNDGSEAIIQGTFLQRIPWEITGIAYLCLVAMIGELATNVDDPTSLIKILYLAVCVCLFGWATLAVLIDFAIRVKLGKWWHNTITYKVLNFILKVLKGLWSFGVMVFNNRSMLRKLYYIYAVILFVQFVFFIAGISVHDGTGLLIVFTLIADVVIGGAIILCAIQMKTLQEGAQKIAKGNLDEKIDTSKMFSEFKKHGESLNNVNEGIAHAVSEQVKSEHFRTELITNVSHDIKTPLTSIINYVDLLSKEDLQNEKANEYIEVLDRQSNKLKKLIEDLVEASKASSGSLAVNLEEIDLGVFLIQTVGEWEERLAKRNLQLVITKPDEPVMIKADGRHLWRVVDNLMNNILKYAQPSSRVYVNLEVNEMVILTFRNISKYPLNISSEELMERFVRGDKSRNTEGHGLGLSIAQSLVKLMNSTLKIYVDGDLFKVVLTFDKLHQTLTINS